MGMYDSSSGDGLDEKKLKRLGLTGGRCNTRKEMQELKGLEKDVQRMKMDVKSMKISEKQ